MSVQLKGRGKRKTKDGRQRVAVTAALLPGLEYAVARQLPAKKGRRKARAAGGHAGGFVVAALPLVDDFAKLALSQVLLDRGLLMVNQKLSGSDAVAKAGGDGLAELVGWCHAGTGAENNDVGDL